MAPELSAFYPSEQFVSLPRSSKYLELDMRYGTDTQTHPGNRMLLVCYIESFRDREVG